MRLPTGPGGRQLRQGGEHRSDELNAHAGVIAVLPVALYGNGLFGFDGTMPAAVIEVYADDDETTIDLCAWSISKPDKFATAIGAASVLGAAQIANAASWAFGTYLKVHRTPLQWIKAGCSGVCPLDYGFAGYELREALGPILAQDQAHAAELCEFLCRPPLDPRKIIFPKNNISKKAA